MALGITDGTQTVGLYSGQNSELRSNSYAFGKNIGTKTSSSAGMTLNKVAGITTDPTKSGVVADLSDGQIVVIKF